MFIFDPHDYEKNNKNKYPLFQFVAAGSVKISSWLAFNNILKATDSTCG